jgi:hypothetical protein
MIQVDDRLWHSVTKDLAKHKEAASRADETVAALGEAIKAQRETIGMYQGIVDDLHKIIGKLEQQVAELKAAL